VQQQAVQQQVVQTPSPAQAAGTPAAQVGDSALIAGECVEEENLVPEVMCGDMPDITQTPWTTCSPTCKTDIQNVVTKIGCCFTKLFSNDERSSIDPSAGVLIV
jgi:hypothetical protein